MNLSFARDTAARSLKTASYSPKKLALIYGAVATGVPLIATLLNFVLQSSIANTSGLAGIGSRSVLSSMQVILSMAVNILLPFWQIGFLGAALGMARQQDVQPRTLTGGFRRWAPVLRLMLLQGFIYFGIAMLCSYAVTSLYVLSPLSDGLLKVMEAYPTEALTTVEVNDAMLEAIMPYMIPVYVLTGVAFLAVCIPLCYSFRMAQFAIMDAPNPRARQALGISRRLMKGSRFSLFKLDLKFWWYYLAQVLLAVIACLDSLLPAIGVTLPVDADTAYFVCYCVYLVLSLLLTWQCYSYVQTTYATCYHVLMQQQQQPNNTIIPGQIQDGSQQ